MVLLGLNKLQALNKHSQREWVNKCPWSSLIKKNTSAHSAIIIEKHRSMFLSLFLVDPWDSLKCWFIHHCVLSLRVARPQFFKNCYTNNETWINIINSKKSFNNIKISSQGLYPVLWKQNIHRQGRCSLEWTNYAGKEWEAKGESRRPCPKQPAPGLVPKVPNLSFRLSH